MKKILFFGILLFSFGSNCFAQVGREPAGVKSGKEGSGNDKGGDKSKSTTKATYEKERTKATPNAGDYNLGTNNVPAGATYEKERTNATPNASDYNRGTNNSSDKKNNTKNVLTSKKVKKASK